MEGSKDGGPSLLTLDGTSNTAFKRNVDLRVTAPSDLDDFL